uniref:Uncharacterized protein n=1 Tax=Glossina austeni TaxID=7395 RepID=A0A1A9VE94_GLOAU
MRFAAVECRNSSLQRGCRSRLTVSVSKSNSLLVSGTCSVHEYSGRSKQVYSHAFHDWYKLNPFWGPLGSFDLKLSSCLTTIISTNNNTLVMEARREREAKAIAALSMNGLLYFRQCENFEKLVSLLFIDIYVDATVDLMRYIELSITTVMHSQDDKSLI